MRRLAFLLVCVVTVLIAAPVRAVATTDPDTTAVCDKSGSTVSSGLKEFLAELEKAGKSAGKDDVTAADQSVKRSGTMLIDLAGKLRKDTEKAHNSELRAATEEFAKELEALGRKLTGVTALNGFDTKRLESLADRVAVVCGQ